MLRWISAFTMALIVGAVVPVGVKTHERLAEKRSKVTVLTALDYVELQQLVAKYAWANDTCGNNGYDYADLYVADGWFTSSRNGQLGKKSQGREALAEAAGGGSRACKKLERPEGLWIHDIVNLVIEPSEEGAVGKSRLVYPSLRGVSFDAEHAGHVGGYQYVFVKTPKGWRFKSVIHVMDHQM